MFKRIVLFLTLTFSMPPLVGAEVDLVANFPVDTSLLTELTKREGLHVHQRDLSLYGPGLQRRKPKRFWKVLDVLRLRALTLSPALSKIVFWNIPADQLKKFDLSKLPTHKMILFMWEPPLILRKMYKPKYHNWFKRIYTYDDDLVESKKYFKFYYPALKPILETLPAFEEKKLCTLIASHHVNHHAGELYSKRIEAIRFFETKPQGEFDLFGHHWPASFTSYRGPIDNKLQTLKEYRFCICFENTSSVKGYITEKIFDCFAAGCVPIYLGAPNVEQYIPKQCFIDLRDFASYDQLYSFIKEISKETYEAYIKNIRNFLQSDQAECFSKAHFAEIFMEAIHSN